jgi:BMFP domain-containing protein YqiC
LASAADVNLLKEQNAALEKRTVQLEGELADMKTKYADLLARVAALETKK